MLYIYIYIPSNRKLKKLARFVMSGPCVGKMSEGNEIRNSIAFVAALNKH